MMMSNNNREENLTNGRKAEFTYTVSDTKKYFKQLNIE